AGLATAARTGRHVGLTAVPHGAKTYLAAALALVADGERLVWIARDAEIGDRVAEELGAWLGDPDAVAVLEPRTALAYERSELVADETAARVAALAAWRSGRARILVASVQALLQHTLDPSDLPKDPRRLASGDRVPLGALRRRHGPVRAGHRDESVPARRRRGSVGGLPLPGDRSRPYRAGLAAAPRRARRPRRGGGIPVASGRRAASRADGRGRAAE